MPIFEFECIKCSHQYEELVFSSDDTQYECPVCKSGDVRKLISAGSFRPNGIPTGSGGFEPPACKSAGGG
ncbi:MAG: zinc ribbon domain-containing protein [Desulfobacterales bacterium]|jgi:putative FmdB family regulatory protein|nr:zinc ribbon domain-containing protein [Desulfobacteraceae bacterium]MBT7085460.1 zinc ribbon domain-containing protein [Desulfobacterales bacterium]